MIATFKTIKTESTDQQSKTYFEFNKDSFSVIVLEKSDAWRAMVSWNDITKFAEQFNLQVEEYYTTLKQYLEGTTPNVNIHFKNRELICYWKDNKITLKYFSCRVEKIEFADCVFNLFDTFSFQNGELQRQNTELSKEVDKLREGNKLLERELSQFVERKKKDEQELLCNFVLVLNEKKRRIQHLTQTLHAFKAGRPILNPEIKLKTRQRCKNVKQEKKEVSESDSSNGDDKDYDTEEEPSRKAEKLTDNTLPSKSQTHKDEDLFSSDNEDADDLPKRKKLTDDTETPLNMPSTSVDRNSNKLEETADVKMEDDSPKISFNTQDLLDCC